MSSVRSPMGRPDSSGSRKSRGFSPGGKKFGQKDTLAMDAETEDHFASSFDELLQQTFPISTKLSGSVLTTEKRKKKFEAEKVSTMKYLDRVEKRTKEATLNLDVSPPKDQPSSQRPLDRDFRSGGKQGLVDGMKQRARDNLSEYMKNISVEEMKSNYQSQTKKIFSEYEDKLEEMARERDRYLWTSQRAEEDLSNFGEEGESLKYTIELLRKKLQKMNEREMENQRKLKVFSKMEPIFEKLSERFHFNSPAEVIDRLESLERSQMDSYTQLLEAQEQKNMMERKIDDMKQQMKREKQKLMLEKDQTIEKTEKKNGELQKQVDEINKQLEKAMESRQKYLDLNFAVVDLWNKCERDSDLIDKSNPLEMPDLSDPVQVITTLMNVLTLHSGTKLGQAMRELSMISNSLWLKFFREQSELKSRPREIFSKLQALVEQKNGEIAKLSNQSRTVRQEWKEMKVQLEKVQRENRKLVIELEKATNLAKKTVKASGPLSHEEFSMLFEGSVVSPTATVGDATVISEGETSPDKTARPLTPSLGRRGTTKKKTSRPTTPASSRSKSVARKSTISFPSPSPPR